MNEFFWSFIGYESVDRTTFSTWSATNLGVRGINMYFFFRFLKIIIKLEFGLLLELYFFLFLMEKGNETIYHQWLYKDMAILYFLETSCSKIIPQARLTTGNHNYKKNVICNPSRFMAIASLSSVSVTCLQRLNKLLRFLSFWLWAYLMKVIPETSRAH